MKSLEGLRTWRMGRVLGLAAMTAVTAFAVPTAHAQVAGAETGVKVETFKGKLADGTGYLVRKPANWNGIVINNLDGALEKETIKRYRMLLQAGYGTALAERRKYDRQWTLNRQDDLRRTQEALAMFRAKFGKPRLAIAFGRSAGGGVALQNGEKHPDTIDGVVALCASMDFLGNAGGNLIFDLFYTLKALLAPNDERLVTHALPPGAKHIGKYWEDTLAKAATTPEGRARIALAVALVQYAIYGEEGFPKPNFDDPEAVVDRMVARLPRFIARLPMLTVVTEKDFPRDLAIRGTPRPDSVGNDGAVYADYWKVSDPAYRRAAEAMYAKAGLSLASDLARLDATPRKPMDRKAFDEVLLGRGLPTVPLFRVDNIGDRVAPPIVSRTYDALVELNGLSDIYRTAYLEESGHCGFRPEQEVAAIEVMRERLETGRWPATDPAALNARAGTVPGDPRIFIAGKLGPNPGDWRFRTYTDALRPATFASAMALVNGYDASAIDASRKRQLLAHLSAAERLSSARQADAANSALDKFVETAKGVPNGVVRTRLNAAAYQLRQKD